MPAAYTHDAVPYRQHWINLGSQKTGASDGYRGVLLFDGATIRETKTFVGGLSARRKALLAAARLRRDYQAHLESTGKRFEVEERERQDALRAAKDASNARRRALTADRVALFRALATQCPDHALVAKHIRAVLDIETDPKNERGGERGDG